MTVIHRWAVDLLLISAAVLKDMFGNRVCGAIEIKGVENGTQRVFLAYWIKIYAISWLLNRSKRVPKGHISFIRPFLFHQPHTVSKHMDCADSFLRLLEVLWAWIYFPICLPLCIIFPSSNWVPLLLKWKFSEHSLWSERYLQLIV